jgi:hypothetical protein
MGSEMIPLLSAIEEAIAVTVYRDVFAARQTDLAALSE